MLLHDNTNKGKDCPSFFYQYLAMYDKYNCATSFSKTLSGLKESILKAPDTYVLQTIECLLGVSNFLDADGNDKLVLI